LRLRAREQIDPRARKVGDLQDNRDRLFTVAGDIQLDIEPARSEVTAGGDVNMCSVRRTPTAITHKDEGVKLAESPQPAGDEVTKRVEHRPRFLTGIPASAFL